MKIKWIIHRREFLKEYYDTGISLKAWCIKKKLSINSARRYIKVRKELLAMRKNNNAQLSDNPHNNAGEEKFSTKNQYVNSSLKGEDLNNSSKKNNHTKKQRTLNKDQIKYIADNELKFIRSYDDAHDYKLFLLNQECEKYSKFYSNKSKALSLHKKRVEISRINQKKKDQLLNDKVRQIGHKYDNLTKRNIFIIETIRKIHKSLAQVDTISNWLEELD